MPRLKTATVRIAQIQVVCGYCEKVIQGQSGFIHLDRGAEEIRRQLREEVKDTPYHNAYSLRETIKCRECGEMNRVPKNWVRNNW